MKYCTHCGTELNDEAVVCPSCGCPTDLYNANSGSNINTNSNNSGLATTAKVFMVIGCVISAFYWIIPLAWTIPMTVIYFKKIKNGEQISTAFKVCSLLFVSLVAGILMLCDKEQ
jgi:uncharacterized membrane protein YvbJ